MKNIQINKQTSPIAKLLWKLVLESSYEDPQFIENNESTYIVVSDEFENLVWQNGDELTESSFYVEELVKNTISKNNFEDNLTFTLKYFKSSEDRFGKIAEYQDEIESEVGTIDDYNVLYDRANENFFHYLIQQTKVGCVPEEVEEWLNKECLTFTTEFSEADCLTMEEIQEVINWYMR